MNSEVHHFHAKTRYANSRQNTQIITIPHLTCKILDIKPGEIIKVSILKHDKIDNLSTIKDVLDSLK